MGWARDMRRCPWPIDYVPQDTAEFAKVGMKLKRFIRTDLTFAWAATCRGVGDTISAGGSTESSSCQDEVLCDEIA